MIVTPDSIRGRATSSRAAGYDAWADSKLAPGQGQGDRLLLVFARLGAI